MIQHVSTDFNNDSEKFEINARRLDAIKILDKNNQFNKYATGNTGGSYTNNNMNNNNNNNNIKSFSSPTNYKNYSNNNNTVKKNNYVTSPYKKPLLLNNVYQQREFNYEDSDMKYHNNLRVYDERKKALEYENI